MSENGKHIVDAFMLLRKVCGEISLLLSTADKLMEERGWVPAWGNTAIANTSNMYYAPSAWLPQDFFRYYKNENLTHILAYISVIVDDKDKPRRIEKALVTAGWYDYGKGKKAEGWSNTYYQRYHTYMPGALNEGEMVSANPKKAWPKEKHKFEWAHSFGLPIDNVNNTDELRNNIIEPLLAGIEEKSM